MGGDGRGVSGQPCVVTLAGTDLVTISEEPLSLEELLEVVAGARIELAPAALDRIRASQAVVDAAVDGPDLVYGLNTGLGHMRNERMSREALAGYQDGIVASHAGGMGAPLPSRIVRAAMAARLSGLARGGSGASVGAAQILVALLNARIHPIVPEIGSVGAADLMHMAAIAQVALGRGRAEVDGRVLDGAEALRQAAIAPLTLGPKDGLALVSANGVAIGHGALVVARAADLASLADVALALSLEAIGGNHSIVDPAVAAAKGIAGQAAAADHIRALLAGGPPEDSSPSSPVDGPTPPRGTTSVQDPLSFRVAPQVHGAFRTFLDVAWEAVETELNASDDNPLVSIADGRLISNGNFQPVVLALAFDAIRPAVAHVGQLSERRMNHLWSTVFAQPLVLEAASGAWATGLQSGLLLRYAAATRYAALRGMAQPATLDIGTLDLAVEDHATNAPETVRRTDEALDALEDILAVELLMARGILQAPGSHGGLGRGGRLVLAELNEVIAKLPNAAASSDLHEAIVVAMRDRLLPALASEGFA
ncbi:MAG: aromatic amino acid lyase [Chloroflexi bacterium]|nr:MAG: aromatic amino acid lyase [Chloroflexota bacterium]